MMKGYERRKKQLSALFIVSFVIITITTVHIYSWEKTPIFTTLFPSHAQIVQLFPDENVKHVKQSKDNIREGEGVVNVPSPSSSIETPSFDAREDEGVVNVPSPLISINSTSSDIRGGEYSRTAQEMLHENTTQIVEKSTSTEISENHHDSKPPKQQLVKPMAPKKPDTAVGNVSFENKACNFGKGRWVTDQSRPLYSGFGCKQWLSGMWACRLTQRTDFGYEKLKWQPKDCNLDDFTGPEFLKRMQDKTLAFIGDSIGRQQFQSLMCMVTGGEERQDVEDVGKEYGLVKARGSIRPDGWAYRFPITNTTILYYWSASLCELDPLDPINGTTYFAMHLDRPPYFLQHYISKFNVIVLNTGHHWNRGKVNANRWVMYVNGKPNTNRKIAQIENAKNLAIYSIVKWVNGELPKYPGLKAFYRSISPRHFFNGDWNSGGTCDSTAPGSLEVDQDYSSDLIGSGAVKGTDVKLLDITALSQVRDEGHISRYSIRATPGVQDCLHWCLPGIPDTWNELLFSQI
ncbi:protein trichome birefringence-like 14 isoform X2 [Rutidosis leptorrhynchoides]|uniref:protein trichome birefringence-like 14 isoform X2 n=1 Tax=Rutidosis leptorrhynchoides TaxID=125765 RepID=UPI003A98E8A0